MARNHSEIGKLGAKIRWANEPSESERFWKNVEIGGFDECWNWKKSVNVQTGYGKRKLRGKHTSSHRIAFLFSRGPIPPKLNICHHCDNRRCCNPLHLFCGTQKDNMIDAIKKGRHTCCRIRKGFSRLNDVDVAEIRKLYKAGYRQTAIAIKFSMHQSVISRIVHYKRAYAYSLS